MPQLVRLSLQEVPASINRDPAAMEDLVAARNYVRDHPDTPVHTWLAFCNRFFERVHPDTPVWLACCNRVCERVHPDTPVWLAFCVRVFERVRRLGVSSAGRYVSERYNIGKLLELRKSAAGLQSVSLNGRLCPRLG